MAENITTLLEFMKAGALSDDDILYLVQGSGSDRDKQVSIGEIKQFFEANHGLYFKEVDLYTGEVNVVIPDDVKFAYLSVNAIGTTKAVLSIDHHVGTKAILVACDSASYGLRKYYKHGGSYYPVGYGFFLNGFSALTRLGCITGSFEADIPEGYIPSKTPTELPPNDWMTIKNIPAGYAVDMTVNIMVGHGDETAQWSDIPLSVWICNPKGESVAMQKQRAPSYANLPLYTLSYRIKFTTSVGGDYTMRLAHIAKLWCWGGIVSGTVTLDQMNRVYI